MLPLTLLALAVAAGLTLWKLLRGYITKSPLDNIPGPQRTSFWRGENVNLASPLHLSDESSCLRQPRRYLQPPCLGLP